MQSTLHTHPMNNVSQTAADITPDDLALLGILKEKPPVHIDVRAMWFRRGSVRIVLRRLSPAGADDASVDVIGFRGFESVWGAEFHGSTPKAVVMAAIRAAVEA